MITAPNHTIRSGKITYPDYIPQYMMGTDKVLHEHDLYQPLTAFTWQSTYFLLNIQSADVTIPDDCDRVVISYQTEYYDYDELCDLFIDYDTVKFLLLSDGAPSDIWPDNVTYVQWISYGHQLELMLNTHGYCTKQHKRTTRFSSLSFRSEYHKAAVTAYLMNEHPDSVLSWHGVGFKERYWKEEEFPDKIQTYLNSDVFRNTDIVTCDSFDQTINYAVNNGEWRHPAYLNAEFNLTNESVYNTEFANSRLYTVPYLTEKTWKPLMAGQPFLPVGQAHTLSFLQSLGMKFDYGFDCAYDDCEQDFTRLEKLFDVLQQLKTHNDFAQARESALHNQQLIVSGKFKANCVSHNESQIKLIKAWYEN